LGRPREVRPPPEQR